VKRPIRIVLALLALAITVPLAACGGHEEKTEADNEGIYLDIGGLFYQVQISRQLNPADPEDRSYLVDLPATVPPLKPNETWFAVFMRAYNLGSKPLAPARNFVVEDTQGKQYRPVPLGPKNIFAYRPLPVQAYGTLPPLDTISLDGPAGGSMLLFRLTDESLAARPLELHTNPPNEPSKRYTFVLDV
jgi:hypothetical protein